MFGDELSQTRIYYVICLTYKFCLRSKSEREKTTITIIFLVVVAFLTNDQGSVSFGPGSASFRYKQKALAFKMK